MPRVDPIPPKRDSVPNFQDSADNDAAHTSKRRGFVRFSEIVRRQQRNSKAFPEFILEKLEPIWEEEIEPVLISEFGRRSTLYIIFFLKQEQNQVVMEIWDPNYVETKPSQVFRIDNVPKSITNYLPVSRSQAEIGILTDW
ncbi:MAG: hypothetical protein KA717_11635 [Woronichinia naegeliana WA131]|jgi:hypothetical protein|uniref:Uncharacterized protein n=1 Tax=Woronichinia naegeliana WA131 TaxID=2824559 RepID=A0A977L0D3_9CYAN|nr:MAG: hypothetical protein KA717_11635 [Woronichinia naegeliana WA131]